MLLLLLLAGLQVWITAHPAGPCPCMWRGAGAAERAARMLLHAGMSDMPQGAAAVHELPGPVITGALACGAAVSMLATTDFSRLAVRMLPSRCQRQSCRLRSISFHMPAVYICKLTIRNYLLSSVACMASRIA